MYRPMVTAFNLYMGHIIVSIRHEGCGMFRLAQPRENVLHAGCFRETRSILPVKRCDAIVPRNPEAVVGYGYNRCLDMLVLRHHS